MEQLMPDTPQKLIETVREALIGAREALLAWNGIGIPDGDRMMVNRIYEQSPEIKSIDRALALLESALGDKTVPLAMLWELFRAATAPNHIPYSKRAEILVSKHMPGYTIK
jgi:hypothetical protein